MKKIFRRLAAFASAALLLFTAFFSPVPVSADAAETDVKFDDTDVLEDLQSIEGFDIQNYRFYSSSEPEMHVINVVEYCYSFYDNLRDNYGLYLYVYNPNGLYIDTDNYGNCVQIAVKYDSDPVTEKSSPMDYEKFDLELCSVCSAPNYERLFYKFKVVDHRSADGKTIAERVNSNARRYDISGIELVREGHSNADEYPLTGKYSLDGEWNAYGSFIFTGYAAGYGPDRDAGSTLDCKISKLETVQLDVKHTFYRTKTSSSEMPGTQNQIDTVYFSVPKRLFDEYGKLQRIKAEWYEYKTKPILVTSNKEYYDLISKYIAMRTDSDSVPDKNYFFVPFDDFWILDHVPMDYPVIYGWNITEGYDPLYDLNPLYYIFGTKDWCDISEYDPYADDVEIQGGVSSNRLYEYIKGYDKTIEKGYLPIKNGRISADLFEDDIDEDRKIDNERGKIQKGYSYYDFDASLDLQEWDSWGDVEHDWIFDMFAWLTDIDTAETGRSISPIEVVTPENANLQDPQLGERLLINSADLTEFRKECDDAFTVDGKGDEEKYVVVFHFAKTEYVSQQAVLAEWVNNGWDDLVKGQAYLAQETVFFDFDVIQLSFLKGEQWTVIAAVSNPIDIVDDISTPTILPDEEGWPDWVKWIVGIAALILILIILWPILPYIIKAVVWIIALPFKLIASLFRKLFGKPERRREEPPQEDPDDKPKEKTTKKKSTRKR